MVDGGVGGWGKRDWDGGARAKGKIRGNNWELARARLWIGLWKKPG